MPCLRAIFCISSIVSWLWSAAILVVVKTGASSCCAGRDLVMLRLGQNAELPQLLVQILHERGDARLECAEIMIVQLLTLGRLAAEEGAAGVDEILAPVIERLRSMRKYSCSGPTVVRTAFDVVVAEQLQDTQRPAC